MQISVTIDAIPSDLAISFQYGAEWNIRVMFFSVQPGHGCPANRFRFMKLNTSSMISGITVRKSSRPALGRVHRLFGRKSDFFFFMLPPSIPHELNNTAEASAPAV